MLLLPGFAPDKGIHVVSVTKVDGSLHCEPVIVPEEVINAVIQSPRGIRWYVDGWNQVRVSELQPHDLPSEVGSLPIASPLTNPGQTIARLDRPRLVLNPLPVVIQSSFRPRLAQIPFPSDKQLLIKHPTTQPNQRIAEKRAIRGVEKIPEPRKARKSAPVPPSDRTTRQAAPAASPVVAQRPRLSLDVIYASAQGRRSSLVKPNGGTLETKEKVIRPPKLKIEESDDPPDEEDEKDDKVTKPRKKRPHQQKGWQSTYNLSLSHNILEEQDFLHTFAPHPMEVDGTREIKYFVDGAERSFKLPRSTYGRSLYDILPPEVPRKFWMHLTRHPLTWDGRHEKIKTNNDLPRRETLDFETSLQSVGMHLLYDFPADERPTYSMHILIRTAILGSPYQTLTTNDLRILLMVKYPFFRTHFSDYWYNQISNVHSRQEYAIWLGTHPTLSASQAKYWNINDVPLLDVPDDFRFPSIKLTRVKDNKGKEHLAMDTAAPGDLRSINVTLDRAPVVVPDVPMPPRPSNEQQGDLPAKNRKKGKTSRRWTPASPPPDTVIATDESDGLSPESEDEFSIADPKEIYLGPLEEEDIEPPSPFLFEETSPITISDTESTLPSTV